MNLHKIVKVQRSLYDSKNEESMLVYDKSRTVMFMAPLSDEVKTLLGDRPKAYFFADLVPDPSVRDGFSVNFGTEAPNQRW